MSILTQQLFKKSQPIMSSIIELFFENIATYFTTYPMFNTHPNIELKEILKFDLYRKCEREIQLPSLGDRLKSEIKLDDLLTLIPVRVNSLDPLHQTIGHHQPLNLIGTPFSQNAVIVLPPLPSPQGVFSKNENLPLPVSSSNSHRPPRWDKGQLLLQANSPPSSVVSFEKKQNNKGTCQKKASQLIQIFHKEHSSCRICRSSSTHSAGSSLSAQQCQLQKGKSEDIHSDAQVVVLLAESTSLRQTLPD